MRLINWAREWIETWRIAPPFSRRRRNLLAAIKEANESAPEDWIEVDPPCSDYWSHVCRRSDMAD